jgi:hypothetical protein
MATYLEKRRLQAIAMLESGKSYQTVANSQHPRIHVEEFPAYAPELNPAEYIWNQTDRGLRGFLNVKGINPNEEAEKTQELNDIIKFRRAIILRSILERKAKAIIDNSTKRAQIRPDVVRAFLNVSNYVHGVRSMEAIVEMA